MVQFIKSLKFIFMPWFWVMNNPYDKNWDKELNQLLDKYEFDNISTYRAFLGETEIWISNYPYSCFYPYIFGFNSNFRPSRLTIERANKKLKRLDISPYQRWKTQMKRPN